MLASGSPYAAVRIHRADDMECAARSTAMECVARFAATHKIGYEN